MLELRSQFSKCLVLKAVLFSDTVFTVVEGGSGEEWGGAGWGGMERLGTL